MIILIDDNVNVLHGDMSTLKFKILFFTLLTQCGTQNVVVICRGDYI